MTLTFDFLNTKMHVAVQVLEEVIKIYGSVFLLGAALQRSRLERSSHDVPVFLACDLLN